MEPAPGDLMTVVPGVRWWRMPLAGPLRHVNGYVLDDDDGGAMAVDTGFGDDAAKAAWRALLDGPLAGTRLSRILCTHMHPDHVGLAGWLSREHDDAPILMTRGEWLAARLLRAEASETVPDGQIAFWRAAGWDDAQIARASAGGYARFAAMVAPLPLGYRRIADGDTVTVGGAAWQVVVGSGHSPEHACLLDRDRGILIAGDQVLPRISPNVSLYPGEPEADPLGEWLASIDRLERLPADLLVLPGHGDPFRGLHPRLKAMRGDHERRLHALRDHLATPRRAVDCFGVLFHRPVADGVLGLATGEALAHLRHLEARGAARREVRDGRWWYSRA